jgi:hypothetical protein
MIGLRNEQGAGIGKAENYFRITLQFIIFHIR